MTCTELRRQEAALQQAVQTTRDEMAAATAEIQEDPANEEQWLAEVNRLGVELTSLRGQLETVDGEIATQCPFLQRVSVTFKTHSEGKDEGTLLHVFVKNRSSDSSFAAPARDFLGNRAEWQRGLGSTERNPYLAFGEALGIGTAFPAGSSQTYDLQLRSVPIPIQEVVLPVVDVHILTDGDNRWTFSYDVTLTFSDGRDFAFTSDADGVTGIALDQNNHNHSGIGVESPFRSLRVPPTPQTDAVLTGVSVEFATHDEDLHPSTTLDVRIVNRLGATSFQDIAVAHDVRKGTGLATGSVRSAVFGVGALPLASPPVKLRDIALPVVYLNIVPADSDRWIFDYQVSYQFRDSNANTYTFTSRTDGVILDVYQHKHAGVYQGAPFPTVTPAPAAQLTGPGVDHIGPKAKRISLSHLQRKLDEFVNHRQGLPGQGPPIRKVRLHNSGVYIWPNGVAGAPPESYYDLQTIEADPPPPGTLTGPGTQQGVRWSSHPVSIEQLSHDISLNSIDSQTITVSVDPAQPTPLVVEIDFETGGPEETLGIGMNIIHFSIRLALTLTLDVSNHRIDVLGWVPELAQLRESVELVGLQDARVTGRFLGEPIDQVLAAASLDQFFTALTERVVHVDLRTEHTLDPGGSLQKQARERIVAMFGQAPDRFDPDTTLRDEINGAVNSWLLGGVLGGSNGCQVLGSHLEGEDLVISYKGPRHTFAPVPADPPVDFLPGTLANIEHIVVLTMENRSFDHMLGYLSLPPAQGGMGRSDVDGLRGHEINYADEMPCPSFPLASGDTTFAPDPPHGYEGVFKAINGGKMDGFAQSYADERGPTVAPRIMGYHTAANVPTYDTLARDFAVGHRWFASHPGPTFCNRFYELTGRLNIDPRGYWEYDNSSSLRPVFTPTIFDALTEQGVSWKYFEQGYCYLRFFERHTYDTTNIVAMDDPVFGFENLAKSGALPSVSFIDPHFVELPPDANCDGPPADIKEGQKLVQRIVESVVASPAWAKTLLLITYDEHGGFYDHVAPPAAAKVAPESLPTYGLRVPTFVVSPWVNGGVVFGHDAAGGPPLYFDHTSILKTIARCFMHEHPPDLGGRYSAASDLSSVLGSEARSGPFRPFIAYNLLYGASKLRLDVQGGGHAPGTILWQFDPNTTDAQQFSFEDAGNGSFYIRTHTASLYLTADQTGAVKQDVKYPAAGSAAQDPDAQRWQLTSASVTALDDDLYTISSVGSPGKVLQPASNSTASGVPVVLGNSSGNGIHSANSWEVTSPLLPGGGVLHP